MGDCRLRVLFLASYFPKPDNPWMGTWALTQAQALVHHGVDLLVVSCTSWLPSALAITSGARAYANCPPEYLWQGNVNVLYPHWLYYPIPPVKQWAYGHPVPYLQLAWWSVKSELCRIIEQFQPDLLFCHHTLPNGWMLAHLPPQIKTPIITLDHDFDEVEDGNLYPQRKAAMQTVANRAWAMLAVSKRMENSLHRLFPETRVFTQHNGIDPLAPALFDRPRPADLHGKTVILTCALFAERKGIPLLVEAFGRIADCYPAAVLRIIGSGSEENKIKATIDQLSLNDRVQLVGKKPHADVLQEMVWADCFALVGWNEPFATVYLEAMAAGKPILCCHDGGITDVIQDSVHGYTVPPKDVAATATALERLLSNSANRQEMGQNAQRLILEKLTWDIKTKELIALFEQAIKQPSSVLAV
jgi:glycosyltransferase involved in cell wall biosynthesis